jgi:TPR repeat protein
VALAGLGSVLLGLTVTLLGRDSESSGGENDGPKSWSPPPSPSRLASVAADACQTNSSAPRLVVSAGSGVMQSDEAAAMGLTIEGAADGAQLVIGGFETGSLFSVGQSLGQNGWSVPASQIKSASITPPRGFAGSMDIVLRLMLPSGKLADQQTLRLEWRPPKPALQPLVASIPRKISATEVHALLARGNALEATGDLAGARLVFQRAAEAGNARAAFMLAETYDPIVLETLRESGLASNVETARVWYAKAKDLGSDEAPERLERLAHRSD